MRIKTGSWYWIPVVTTCLFSLLMTFPVWLRPATTLIGDHPSDAMGMVSALWENRQQYLGGLHPREVAMTGAPLDRVESLTSPPWYRLGDCILFRLANRLGEIPAYNILVLSSFLLTALLFPLLLREILSPSCRLTPLLAASTIGTLTFTLSPYHLAQAQEHDKLAAVQWLVLAAWLLTRFRNRPTLCRGLLALTGWVWCFLWDFQLGYFMAVFAGALLIIDGLWSIVVRWKTSPAERSPLWPRIRIGLALGLALTPMIAWTVVKLYPSLEGIQRPLDQMYQYAAYPRDYLLPPRSHPVLGRYAEDVMRRLPEPSKPTDPVQAQYVVDRTLVRRGLETEVTVYLGWIPLLLGLYGLTALSAKRKDHPRLFRESVLMAAVGVVGFLWSLPPTIVLLGLKIPLPSLWLHNLLPMFRVSARFGVDVMLCVSILAAMGTYMMISRPSRTGERTASCEMTLPVVLVLLILFEFTDIPPLRFTEAANPPSAYQFLAHQPGKFIIAEYPMYYWYEWKHLNYRFWQTAHGRALLNGPLPGSAAYPVCEVARDLSDPATLTILRLLGVRYLVVHEKDYRVDTSWWLRSLRAEMKSGTDTVYELSPLATRNPIADRIQSGKLTSEDVLDEASRLGPSSPRLNYQAGQVYAEKGDWLHARERFGEVIEAQPGNAEAQLKMGTCYLFLNMPSQAIRHLEAATTLAGATSETCFLLGSAYAQIRGMEKRAIRNFRKCLKLEPDHSARKQMMEYLKQHSQS